MCDMVLECDSSSVKFQPPLSNRSLCLRTTVAGRGLFLQAATMEITESQLIKFWNNVKKTDFGVNKASIYRIIENKAWKDI